MPPGRPPNDVCGFGGPSWGWIENHFPTKLDRRFRSLPGGELSGLLGGVVAPAARNHVLKNVPQHFVNPETTRTRRGPGHLRRLDLRSVVNQ